MACEAALEDKEDAVSVSSERFFKEEHRGDSRKWILRDASRRKDSINVASTMKDTLRSPVTDKTPLIGIRRIQLREKLIQEVTEEVVKEMNEPPPVEEYCTVYDGTYNAEGFVPKEHDWDSKLHEKFPLYGDHAVTYYKSRMDETPKGTCTLTGFTPVRDLNNPFKKSCKFTKPIGEVLDESNEI